MASRSAPTSCGRQGGRSGLAGAAFEVPQEAIAAWRAAGARSRGLRAEWQQRLALKPADIRGEPHPAPRGKRPAGLDSAVAALKDKLAAAPQTVATAKRAEIALRC